MKAATRRALARLAFELENSTLLAAEDEEGPAEAGERLGRTRLLEVD